MYTSRKLEMFIKWNGNVYYATGSTYSRIIFQAMPILRIHTKLWKKLEKFNLYQGQQFC